MFYRVLEGWLGSENTHVGGLFVRLPIMQINKEYLLQDIKFDLTFVIFSVNQHMLLPWVLVVVF